MLDRQSTRSQILNSTLCAHQSNAFATGVNKSVASATLIARSHMMMIYERFAPDIRTPFAHRRKQLSHPDAEGVQHAYQEGKSKQENVAFYCLMLCRGMRLGLPEKQSACRATSPSAAPLQPLGPACHLDAQGLCSGIRWARCHSSRHRNGRLHLHRIPAGRSV